MIRPWAGSGIETYAGGPKRSSYVTRPYFEWAKGELGTSWSKYTTLEGAGGAADAVAGAAEHAGWWSGLPGAGKAAIVAGGVAAVAIGAKLIHDRDS